MKTLLLATTMLMSLSAAHAAVIVNVSQSPPPLTGLNAVPLGATGSFYDDEGDHFIGPATVVQGSSPQNYLMPGPISDTTHYVVLSSGSETIILPHPEQSVSFYWSSIDPGQGENQNLINQVVINGSVFSGAALEGQGISAGWITMFDTEKNGVGLQYFDSIQFDTNAPMETAWDKPPVVGGVPEPSTWAMLLVGFVGLGYAGLRQRKTARLAV